MRYCRTTDQFHQRIKYKTFKVDFRALDLTMDALPQTCSKYKYLFFSVHLSNVVGFKTSIDKLVGRMTSGRVITKPAFNLWPVEEKTICSASDSGGIIRTTFTN